MSAADAGQATHADAVYSRQREKSEAMRLRVCEATISHLAEYGYFRTSIGKISERARVSQGALQHHYPTKEELIAAVADLILLRSVKWFSIARGDLERDRDAFAEIVRRSWREQFCSQDYGALLEILTACRTDAALKGRITPALERWRRLIDAEITELLPATRRTAVELDAILSISRAMMTGLLVHDQLLKDEGHIDLVINQWIELLRR
jgi:AcrR family transcriptional regulator